MQNLKSLSNEALLKNTQALVAEERKLTTSILWHLNEIQKRRLYAEKGYCSLFEYAVQALGYSEAAAGRRISAMRLLVDVPEIEPALKDGSVNLSTLSTIQSFIQRKQIQNKEKPVSKIEKRELVFALQGKSRRECEKHLVALDPIAATPQEKERVISPTQTEIRFVADDALMEKLKRIRELDGHVQSNPSYLELFHRLADLALKKLDPLATPKNTRNQKLAQHSDTTAPAAQAPDPSFTPPAELNENWSPKAFHTQFPRLSVSPSSISNPRHVSNPRFVSAALRREIWERDQGSCTYRSKEGKRCGSRFAIEIDHIQPLALGGKSEVSNMRLLCRNHNQQQAIDKLGPHIILPFLKC